MSLRGRVIRRHNVSCYLKPQSIQEQEEQFNYLARALRKTLNEAQAFAGFYTWSLYMTQNNLFVRVKDIYPSWDGKATALAVRLPVQMVSVLDIWVQNLGGTVFASPWKTGYLYKLANGDLNASFETFSWGGQTIAQNTICRVTISSSPEYPLVTTMIGAAYQYQKGTWTGWTANPVECYFVHPFFDTEIQTNSQSSQVIMFQPKV